MAFFNNVSPFQFIHVIFMKEFVGKVFFFAKIFKLKVENLNGEIMIQHLNSRKKKYTNRCRKFKNFVPAHISLNIQKKFLEDYTL